LKQQSGTLSWLRAVYFLDDERGWAVGGTGVLLSTADGGKSWKVLSRPTADALRDLFFTDAETGWLVCDKSVYQRATGGEARSYLLRTKDGGASWQRVEPAGAQRDVRLVRVVFADAARGWVFGEMGALFATQDGGATWMRQSVPTRHLLLGGAFLDAAQGWLVGAGATILHTADSGATWRAGYIEPQAAHLASNSSAASAENVSAANAASTSTVAARLNAVSFVDARRGWAVGTGGAIFNTNNGGNVWRAQSSGTTFDLSDVKFLDAQEGWAVGTSGTLLHTTDGGARWRLEQSGTTHPLERLFFTGRTRGWAVGFGGTILAYAPTQSAPAPKLKGVALN
jgi:photosystem II stability/assembly factor-like uncharacterized protein